MDLLQRLTADPGLPVPAPTPSYWQEPAHKLDNVQSASLPTETDTIIIGSGITASSVARELLLHDADSKITVLEARGIVSGATARNGGHISTAAVADYNALVDVIGKESAQKILRFRLAHYDAIRKVVEEIGGDAFEASEIRKAETVIGVLYEQDWARIQSHHARFEEDNPELSGQWRLYEKTEATKVFTYHL